MDIGGWYGWLSRHLAGWGHHLTVADYFDDERDGLRARQFYPVLSRIIPTRPWHA